jgi:hypothetical protein
VVAAPTTLAARAWSRARLDALALPLLAGIVSVSFALRLVTGWLRATPNYFSDEYLYAELGRSLVESGRPLVRGASIGFPSLLQPVLTAPAWLADDVWLSYRLIQGLGALAMSLAAVPVFLLARRLGTSTALALCAAAFSVAIPDLLFASWLTAEPFAYPLLLGAALAATVAIAEPSRRHQLLFALLAGLAVFTRIQFVVLPLCFLAAVVIVGLRERRVRGALREQRLALAVFAAVGLAVAVAGASRVLGLYGGVLDEHADPLGLIGSVGLNALVLAYSSGWILVPGALLALGLALARPRNRSELAFAAFSLPLVLALLLEAGLFGAADHAQERYVFYALPLAAVAFCLYAARGWPYRLHHALLATALLTVSAVVPLAGFAAAEGKVHSPLLFAAFQVEQWLGSPGNGSLVFAAGAAALSAAAVLLSGSPRVGGPVALMLAVAASGAVWACAVTFDSQNSVAVREAFLPADPSWVDRAGLEDVVLVRGPHGVKTEALEQLFWNRSVDRVALLPGADQLDHVHSPGLRVAPDGTLLAHGRPLRQPLLLDGYAGTIRLADARRVASSPSFSLWKPRGAARLSLYFAGRYSDGWLAGIGRLYLWPGRMSGNVAGTVAMTLTAPAGSGPMTLRFQTPGGSPRRVRLLPGIPEPVRFEACSRGPWVLTFTSDSRGFVGSRIVSAQATEPTVVPGACVPRAGSSRAAGVQSA